MTGVVTAPLTAVGWAAAREGKGPGVLECWSPGCSYEAFLCNVPPRSNVAAVSGNGDKGLDLVRFYLLIVGGELESLPRLATAEWDDDMLVLVGYYYPVAFC
jgi:hypothetical protein